MMFRTMQEIRNANHDLGHHFFEKSTLQFFNSRILSGLYGGRYFVTSEKAPWPDAQRTYTVRMANADGSIDTVGEFEAFTTADAAKKAARKLAETSEV